MNLKSNRRSAFQNSAVPSHRKLLKVLEIQKLKISVSSLSELGGNRR